MRIPTVAFFVLLCLSGCAAKPAAEIPEPEPGMQLVECASSKDAYSPITAYVQIPNDWKLEAYDSLYGTPGSASYALMVMNSDKTEWVSGGEVLLFEYSDYLDGLDQESRDYMLPSVDEIKDGMEKNENLTVESNEKGEYQGYPALYSDYFYKQLDNFHSRDVFVTNEKKDKDYFSIYVRMSMDVVDEETADKILDSLVIAE